MADVVRHVRRSERAAVLGIRQHLSANALHGDERIADDASFGRHSLLLAILRVAFVAQLFRARVRRTQIPRQPLERIERSEGYDVPLSHGPIGHELSVGTVAPDVERAMSFELIL